MTALRALMLLGLVCACSAGVARGAATEIYFFQRGYVEGGRDAATSLTVAAVRAFEQRNPAVRVRVMGVPWGQEGDLKLRTALLSRRKIDVFRLSNDQLPGFLPRRGQLLLPIDRELTPTDIADYGPALESVRRDGQTWAWPLWSTAVVLLANRELLDRAGVAPPASATPWTPWTWEEFTANLVRLKATRTRDGQAVIPFTAAARPPMIEWAPLLVAHCGPLFPEAAEAAAGAGVRLAPQLPEALERVRALRVAGLMSPAFGVEDQPAVQALFTQGRLALLMTSPGFLKTVAAGKIPACVLPVPQGAYGRPITTGGLGCVAVVASGDAARESAGQALARWLTSAEIAEAVPGWYLAPPARRSVKAFYARPLYAPLEAILPTARYIAPTVSVAFFEETILPNLQAVLLGQAPAASALEKIDKAWRRMQLD